MCFYGWELRQNVTGTSYWVTKRQSLSHIWPGALYRSQSMSQGDHMWLSSLGWQSGLTWLYDGPEWSKKKPNYCLVTLPTQSIMELWYHRLAVWLRRGQERWPDQRIMQDMTYNICYVFRLMFSIELQYYSRNYIKSNLSHWLWYYYNQPINPYNL